MKNLLNGEDEEIKLLIKKLVTGKVKLKNIEKQKILSVTRRLRNQFEGKKILILNREGSTQEIKHNDLLNEKIRKIAEIANAVFKN